MRRWRITHFIFMFAAARMNKLNECLRLAAHHLIWFIASGYWLRHVIFYFYYWWMSEFIQWMKRMNQLIHSLGYGAAIIKNYTNSNWNYLNTVIIKQAIAPMNKAIEFALFHQRMAGTIPLQLWELVCRLRLVQT